MMTGFAGGLKNEAESAEFKRINGEGSCF